MDDLNDFIAGLPKAELHLHLEGSFEPEQMFAIARRNRCDIPFNSAEEVKAAYRFSNLQDFRQSRDFRRPQTRLFSE